LEPLGGGLEDVFLDTDRHAITLWRSLNIVPKGV
jgi:hypothetical protein